MLCRNCTENEVLHSRFLQLMRPTPQETADWLTLIEGIPNGKPHFLQRERRI